MPLLDEHKSSNYSRTFASGMVTFNTSKIINAPLDYVYYWCTDFRDDDPKITGSKRTRKVISKTRDRVIYGTAYSGRDGKDTGSIYIVTLNPPDGWHLDKFGGEDVETGDYKLTPMGKKKTRLDMKFRQRFRSSIGQSQSKKELAASSLERWHKYASALERDFDSGHLR
ncbi:MAG: hypothetical protein ACREBS_02880 [Nitrososphaerales archaeon]